MNGFINQSNHGRNLGAKARLARATIEGKHPELKRELIFLKEFRAGNWFPDKEKLESSISKSEALRLILSLSEFEIETLVVLGIIPKAEGVI